MSTLIRSESSYDTGSKPQFRVWHAWNIPQHMDFYAVDGPEEAKKLIEELILADLDNPDIDSNAFGLEELEGDDRYHEWYSEEGDSIEALVDKEREA